MKGRNSYTNVYMENVYERTYFVRHLGDNRIVFEDLPTYIGGLYVANLVWPATR